MPIGTVSTNDMEQGFMLAASALYGDMLKDYVSDDKKAEIFKKISLIRVLYNATVCSELLSDYPQVQAIVADNNEEQLIERKRIPGLQGSGAVNLFVEHPETEKLIKLHREGLKELSGLLEQRLTKGNFKTLSEQNYCYMIKSFLDDLIAGKDFTKSALEDKQFEFSYNLTAKLRTTSAIFQVSNEGEFEPQPHYTQDSEVFKRIESTGIVNSMAGGKRIYNLTQKHLESGDIARGELLEEYKQQLERLKKHFSLTKEEFNDLVNSSPDLKLFDNEYDEIAGQRGRGFLWAKVDLETKISAMEAGWPVSDLNALAHYANLINTLEGEILSNKNLIKANEDNIKIEMEEEKPDQEQIERWKKQNETARNKNAKYEKALSKMKDPWMEFDDGVVDAAKRMERLQKIQKTLNDLSAGELKDFGDSLTEVKNMIDERVNAKPAEHEKVLLVNTATEMLESLKDVDPALVKSSEAFKKFKEELKNLAEMEKDGKCNVRGVYYQEQATKVMEAGASYLRYKTKQLHGDSSHKRSDLEERRVRMVDSIIGRLNVAYVPGQNQKIYSDPFNPVYNKGFDPDVIYEEVIDKSVKSYDNYVKLHTGRVAANGTKEEMLEDLSKVIAAQALKKAYGEPFSKKEIDKQAKTIRMLYNLDELKPEKLADALRAPGKAESFVKDRQKELSEIKGLFLKDNKGGYKNYRAWWNNMSALYRVMNDPKAPRVKSEAYTKLFEAVEEAAHMPRPDALGKMNKEQIERKVAQLNFRMMQFANKAVDEKGFQDKDMNHDALFVLYTLKGWTSGASHIINDIDDRIDKKRFDKEPESLKFVSEGLYDINKMYQKRKEANDGKELRKPDEEKILKNERKYNKIKSGYTYMGSGLDINTAFEGKYKDAVLIDGELPKEKAESEAAAAKKAAKKANGPKKENDPKKKDGPKKNAPKVTKEEPAPKARPHL